MDQAGHAPSVRDVVTSIRTWMAGWNGDPKAFVWYTTADDILDGLATY